MKSGILSFARVDTDIGELLIAGTTDGIVYLSLSGMAGLDSLRDHAATHYGQLKFAENPSGLSTPLRELREYFGGKRKAFEVDLAPAGSNFELSVWVELCRIPYGETRSYGELAQSLGEPGAARAVGGANGRNPIPILIPCHRCVAANGLGGFSGGLENKVRLLELERRHAASGQRVFPFAP